VRSFAGAISSIKKIRGLVVAGLPTEPHRATEGLLKRGRPAVGGRGGVRRLAPNSGGIANYKSANANFKFEMADLQFAISSYSAVACFQTQ
jgi:hypothetical protein